MMRLLGYCYCCYWLLLVKIKANEIQNTPVEVYKDPNFLECLGKGECGLKSKCFFDLPNLSNKSDDSVSIKGNIFLLSNSMDYTITYYWNLFFEPPSPYFGNQDDYYTLYGVVKVLPNSIAYFDTGEEEMQAIRLYVPLNSTSSGNDVMEEEIEDEEAEDDIQNSWNYSYGVYRKKESKTLFHLHTEQIQTHSLTTNYQHETKCTLDQACRLLLSVCYLTTISESGMNLNTERCLEYEEGCGHFDVDEDMKQDDLAKDFCLNDCVMEYYGYAVNLDSEVAVAWFLRGGAAKGGSVDGYFNVQFVIAIGIVFYLVVMFVMTVILSARGFKRKLKSNSADLSLFDDRTTTPATNNDDNETTLANDRLEYLFDNHVETEEQDKISNNEEHYQNNSSDEREFVQLEVF